MTDGERKDWADKWIRALSVNIKEPLKNEAIRKAYRQFNEAAIDREQFLNACDREMDRIARQEAEEHCKS
jgi:hypothetical protein